MIVCRLIVLITRVAAACVSGAVRVSSGAVIRPERHRVLREREPQLKSIREIILANQAWNPPVNDAAICLLYKIVQLSLIKCNYYRLVSLFAEWRRPYRLGGAIALSLCLSLLLGCDRLTSAPLATFTRNLRAALRVFRQARCVYGANHGTRRYITRRPRYITENKPSIIECWLKPHRHRSSRALKKKRALFKIWPIVVTTKRRQQFPFAGNPLRGCRARARASAAGHMAAGAGGGGPRGARRGSPRRPASVAACSGTDARVATDTSAPRT